MMRTGRRNDELRAVQIVRHYTGSAAGSVLYRAGRTLVLCTASIASGVPAWREASGKGWLTCEYDMLPGSTPERKARSRTKLDGRTHEIQRLIGRSLRVAVDLAALGPHTIHLDCDVLEADGGTRTAAVTGAYVALRDALSAGREKGLWQRDPHVQPVAAVSAGVIDGEIRLDLDYSEDVAAQVDCNLVMTGGGEWVEVQATGENATLTDAQLTQMLSVGRGGIRALLDVQRAALAGGAANAGR